MAFKLLNLPYLAQIEIIRQMNWSDIFILSITSSKAKRAVQRSQLKSSILRYGIYGDNQRVYVSNGHKDKTCFLCMKNIGDGIIQYEFNFGKSNLIVGLRKVRRKDHLEDIVHKITYTESDRIRVQTEIYDHILSLFRDSPGICVEGTPIDIMNRFIKLENVVHSCFIEDDIEAKDLDDYFSFYPNQKGAGCSIINGELKSDSKIYELDTILLHTSGTSSHSFLENFNGTYIIALEASCSELPVIQFLRRWVNGGDDFNVEFFLLHLNDETEFNPDTVVEEFEMKPWDDAERPKEYYFKQKIFWPDLRPKNCSGSLAIEREKDKKMASVAIWDKGFIFLNWN